MSKGIVLTGTIGSDTHAVGQWVVSKFLEEKGFTAIKLGVAVSQQEFVEAAVETNADAIFVSSLYGMGFADSQGMRERLTEAGKGGILLYIGGILAVSSEAKRGEAGVLAIDSEAQWIETERKFKEVGFDRVYSRDVNLEDVVADLEEDLKKRGSEMEVA